VFCEFSIDVAINNKPSKKGVGAKQADEDSSQVARRRYQATISATST